MLLTADRVIHEGYAYSKVGIDIGPDGRIAGIGFLAQMGRPDCVLAGRVLLAGQVNAHSQVVHRLWRGREVPGFGALSAREVARTQAAWLAERLDAEQLRVVARQTFVEMLLAGVTTVGEFFAWSHRADGEPYEDPHHLAQAVIEAAREVGIRLSLIRAVALRGDYGGPLCPEARRSVVPGVDVACEDFDALVHRILGLGDPRVSWAMGVHGLATVPWDAVVALKLRMAHMPLHIVVSQYREDVADCRRAYGAAPVELLARCGILDACTTLVHATHIEPREVEAIARSGALVSVCPSAQAEAGAGWGCWEALFARNVPLCLGTAGQSSASLLMESGRLEMDERLRLERRHVLAAGEGDVAAHHLLRAATHDGATALGLETGSLRVGKWADFVALDINDPALCGADDWSLLPAIVFAADKRAVREVMVGGRWVVEDGTHPLARQSGAEFSALCQQLFFVPAEAAAERR